MGRLRQVVVSLVSVSLLIGMATAYMNRQNLWDWWRLQHYEPSRAIVKLAEEVTMTDYARRLFFVNYPKIQDRAAFYNSCRNFGEQTIVLGCYDGLGIYLYNVDDPRLDGVLQVTAAHETLHAAYDRLSKKARKVVDAEMDKILVTLKDTRLLKLVEQYRQRDPSSLHTELHSIFGTELADLSPKLEAHYKKYFTKRETVVAYSAKYEGVFSDLQQKLDTYDKDLNAQKIQIEEFEANLKSQQEALESARRELDKRLAANDIAGYNALVNPYNAKVNSYNTDLATYKTKIAYFNVIVEQRNRLSVVQSELIQRLDSRLSPPISEYHQ